MGSALSSAAQVLIAIIPIVGIVTGGIVVFFYLLWRHKQNLRMIEKGVTPSANFDVKSFSLIAGLLTGWLATMIADALPVAFLGYSGYRIVRDAGL